MISTWRRIQKKLFFQRKLCSIKQYLLCFCSTKNNCNFKSIWLLKFFLFEIYFFDFQCKKCCWNCIFNKWNYFVSFFIVPCMMRVENERKRGSPYFVLKQIFSCVLRLDCIYRKHSDMFYSRGEVNVEGGVAESLLTLKTREKLKIVKMWTGVRWGADR